MWRPSKKYFSHTRKKKKPASVFLFILVKYWNSRALFTSRRIKYRGWTIKKESANIYISIYLHEYILSIMYLLFRGCMLDFLTGRCFFQRSISTFKYKYISSSFSFEKKKKKNNKMKKKNYSFHNFLD